VSDVLDSGHATTLDIRRLTPPAYTQSLSPWASGSDCSFFSVLFSI
jgi:hypothetical protein